MNIFQANRDGELWWFAKCGSMLLSAPTRSQAIEEGINYYFTGCYAYASTIIMNP